jgi:hypothetical protein
MGNEMSDEFSSREMFFHELEIIPGFNEQVTAIINRYLEFSKLSIYLNKPVFCTIDGPVYFKGNKLHRVSDTLGPQEPTVKINCVYSEDKVDTYIFNIELCYKEGLLHANNGYAVYIPGTGFGEYWKDGKMEISSFELLNY